jgi:putative transcriptional regulator
VSERTIGRLLIAEPNLGDDNFERTVILMIEHNDEGALGLVLNRPSELDVAQLVPDWSGLTVDPPVLFVGGPVSQNGVIALGRVPGGREAAGWTQVVGSCGTVDLNHASSEAGSPIEGVRLFAGYSGWGPGQLDGELALGAWYVVDALPGDAFAPQPERLWNDILSRQESELNLLGRYPIHPSLN